MNTIRIDKYLAQLNLVSRREAKKVFRSGAISLNGYEERDHGFLIREGDIITYYDQEIIVKFGMTILLNKPAGYVCSEIDEGGHLSYKQLLQDYVYAPMLKVAGRLDQDTTGLVVATSDGDLIHRIISPKKSESKHKNRELWDKEYIVTCAKEVSDSDLDQLRQGVTIDGDYLTLPSTAVRVSSCIFHLTLVEGKFHQIKKMCEAIGNECITLQRIRVGKWTVEGIEEGKWREVKS